MTLKTEETLLAICDNLGAGLSYSAAARSNGVSPRTFWQWVKDSKAGAEDLIIEFLGERIPFYRAVNASRRMLHLEMRSNFERRSLLGHDEKIFYAGLPTFVELEECVGLDEETRWMLGYPRDGLKRDANGNRIQHTIHHEPPVAAVLRALEVSFPDEYQPKSTTTVNSNVNGMVGVAIVPRPSGPPSIPPPPPMPVLPVGLPQAEVLPENDTLRIPEMDSEADDDDAVEADADDQVVAVPAPQTVVIREPTPAALAPTPLPAPLAPTNAERSGKPLSPLLQDLISRARGPVEQRSAPITMQPTLDRSRNR